MQFSRISIISGISTAVMLSALLFTPGFTLSAHADDAASTPPPAPQCHRTSLSEAISLARAAIAEKHRQAEEEDEAAEKAADADVVDVLWAELAITAVPRYYDVILFDKERNYFARIDEATTRVLNLTRPGEARDKTIRKQAEQLFDTVHVRLEDIIAGAQQARPRGIPTAARLNHIYGQQPVYEVVMRMPPGNDEVLLVDGLSGNVIELENFE